MSLDDDIAFLEKVPLFAALDKQALQILAIGAETKQLQSGAVLFYAGELADGGYLVQDGSLSLEPGTFAERGDITVGRGTLVGELALVTDMVCQATAIAREPTVVIRISRSLFRKMLESYPAAAVALREILAKRLDVWQRDLGGVKKKLLKNDEP